MTAKAFAAAKINLTLHVTGQRADGYHLLDSLVVFADVGDMVAVAPGDGLTLSVSGPNAAGVPVDGRNLVLKAARLAGVENAAIALDKHLPAEAGIGGGSSDAAATLQALNAAFGTKIPAALERLGADVPVCFAAGAARMWGTGEHVQALAGFPTLPAVLVNPNIAVATPPVFKALVQKDGAPMPKELPRFDAVQDVALWLRGMRNDLQPPATALHPGIGAALAALDDTADVCLQRMSGSGSTCFALYPTIEQAQLAAQQIHRAQPQWWVRSCLLG